MNTYAFITGDSFRVEVKASTPQAGYNKLKSISCFDDKKISKNYYKYSKAGFCCIHSVRTIWISKH